MGPVTRVEDEWAYRGFKAVTLENARLRVTVIPDVGAKIHAIVSKALDRNLLYSNPRVEMRRPVFGANVDNYWTGGLDDALPSGHRCVVGGEEIPFLGEAWSLPWSYERTGTDAVTFTRLGVITPFQISRTVRLAPEESIVRLSYRIANVGSAPFDFIWGVHPGIPVGPATHIQIPAATGVVDESWPDDRLGAPGTTYAWPLREMTELAADPGGTWDLHYAIELQAGWAAVWDGTWGGGVGLRFDRSVFRNVWVWLVDGGWRSLRCVAVEPWTGYPARLDHAIESGRATRLCPGEVLETEVELIAFETDRAITGFSDEGVPLR
jgi:galactose mutarotase-like enzyme